MPTQNIFNLVDTWASGGGPYTSIKMNATDNDVGSASLLMDLQVGGSSRFKVDKTGAITATLASGTNAFSTNGRINADNGVIGGYDAALNGNLLLGNAVGIRWANSTSWAGTIDTFLTRRAAANLRLGAADAAAPVAQTLSVQSVVAGTTNTAGANFTITGSQGTGTGAGGSIVFQVAPAGLSGPNQNALATALTINPSGTVSIGGLTIDPSNGGITFAQTFGITMQTSNAFTIRHGNGDGLDVRPVSSGSPNIILKNASSVIQAALWGEATNTLALRNGANAQSFRVYNTYTSDTNYESGRLQWVGNEFRIGPETVGGTLRSMGLYVGGTRYQIIGSNFNQFDQNIYMNVANIVTDTSTGFKIGTGTTQKIGFWNATPIAQPTTAVAAATVAATGTGDVVAASTTFDGYTIPQIVKALRNAGLLA